MPRRSPVQSIHAQSTPLASEAQVTSASEEPAWKQRAVERSIKTAKLRAAPYGRVDLVGVTLTVD